MSEADDWKNRIMLALWQADGHDTSEWHDVRVGEDRAIYARRAEYVMTIAGPIDPLYTTEATAEIFAVTPETIRDWLNAGKIKGIKPDGYWRVPRSEILRVANARNGD